MILDGHNKKFSDTKIYIWDEKQRILLKELECYNIITQFEFLREYLIVQSEGKFPKISLTSISNLATFRMFPLSFSTNSNCFSMNSDENKPLMAYMKTSSSIYIYNFLSDFEFPLESKYDEIQSFIMNNKGDRIAIANKDGTYICIYSLPERNVLVELYRGRKACKIKQMDFINNGHYFLVQSDRETLHIYDIERKEVNFSLIPVGIIGMIQGKYLSSFAKYYINQQKFVKKGEKDAFLAERGMFREAKIVGLEEGVLTVIKDNGDYEKLKYDLEKGGWGTKIKEKEWFDGWDLVEENIKLMMKVFGNALSKKLAIKPKKNDEN